jgi:chemotaxis response regulator CheB
MQRVLIIAEDSQQQERLRIILNPDRSLQVTTATARQINAKNFRLIRQSDLIVLEESPDYSEQEVTEHLLTALKQTGLPIMLLPPAGLSGESKREPLVLNLTEETVAQPGLVALINKIRLQYISESTRFPGLPTGSREQISYQEQVGLTADTWMRSKELATPSPEPFPLTQPSNQSSKITYTLTAIDRISKELREPLSNMNLAIHMLGKTNSLEERDRYLKLLREEYKRELQLVTELENLQASLAAIL